MDSSIVVSLITFLLTIIGSAVVARAENNTRISGWTPDLVLEELDAVKDTYQVTTDDGYNLEVWRLNDLRRYRTESEQESLPPVLMLHGILDTGLVGAYNYRENSLATQLLEAGFDVWAINFRGSTYSMTHEWLDETSDEYWAFDWDLQAEYDLPNVIDFILNKSSHSSVSLIGHSMGTTTVFSLLSTPEHFGFDVSKINAFVGLAPVVYVEHMSTAILEYLTNVPEKLTEEVIYKVFGHKGVFVHEAFDSWVADFCYDNSAFCAGVIRFVGGESPDPEVLDESRIYFYVNFWPAGASVQSLAHYLQNFDSGEFNFFNYGTKKNREIYGQSTAPGHDLSLIPKDLPILLMHGDYDILSDKQDVDRLIAELKSYNLNDFNTCRVEKYAHGDFIWGTDSAELVGKPVVDFLLKHSGHENEETQQ